ncbi:MAG: HAMP domain-containing sensor histidine kinase [Myxococcaceae bacterium]
MTLRHGFSAVMATLLAVVVAVALAFVLSTAYLNRLAENLAASVESVRLVQEAEVGLLLHARARDPLVRDQLQRELRNDLEEAGAFVMSAEESEIYAAAVEAMGRYLEASREVSPSEPVLTTAYAALERLVQYNVNEARAARSRAASLARTGDYLAVGVAVLFVVAILAILSWVHRKIIAPVVATAAAMDAFRRGNRASRAPVEGPHEIAQVGKQYNEMAGEIVNERDRLQLFLGSVAHDLRNPLSALKLTTSRPLNQDVPQERLLKTVTLVRRQVERLDRMIGDLVDATRIEGGELEVRPSRTDACALADEVVKLFEATSPNHLLRLDCPAPEAPVYLEADASRLVQVLNNLVSNAIKYSPGGEVSISVHDTGDEVVFRVTDQGIGMSEEEQKEIFQPFRRVGISRESIPGVGLGLFAVRRIVEAHHGRVSVQSAPGRGSTFEVRLPKRQPASRVPTEPEEAAPTVH